MSDPTDQTRHRSHWGWGWADRFPSADERLNVGQMVAALLGVPAPERALEPVPLAAARLPTPTLDPSALPASLRARADASDGCRAQHTWGRAFPDIVRGFHGDFSAAPDLVVSPESADEVEALLAWAAAESVAVIPCGGGTSVVAGTEPSVDRTRYRAAVSLDTRAMRRILDVDPVAGLATIEAGALGPDLEAGLAPHGLTLRHFPQSFEFSTLGGWIATRAGGHFATLYTHIDERVASVRMVTPTGRYASRTLPGSGAGPSPDRTLAIGSEGIFGVITDATVRVVKRPTFRARASLRFDRHAAAVDACREIVQAGLWPANCRVLDGREATLFGVGFDGRSILLLGFESADHSVEPALRRALEIAAAHGGRVDDAGVRIEDRQSPDAPVDGAASDQKWRAAFIDAPYLINTVVSLGLVADTFETACTWSAFPALHRDVIAAVRAASREVCGHPGYLSCRFTHAYPDGPAPYYTFVSPLGLVGQPLPEERTALADAQRAAWLTIKTAASEVLDRHGATITHHHAVGRTHRPWYDRQRPEPFARALEATKAALDPARVLNPGVLID